MPTDTPSLPDMPTFVLGVGAQKAGTTWLHAYFNHFNFCDFGEIKEYHIWDGLYVEAFDEFDMRRKSITPRRRLRHLKNHLIGRPQEPIMMRRRFQFNTETYFDYFAKILTRPGIEITGDITPSYSALPAHALSDIKAGFKKRGIKVKVAFLMREPVNRCLSAIRMYQKYDQSRQGVDVGLPDEKALLSYIQSPQAVLRTNYHMTLQALSSVFDPIDIYVGVYESMFTPAELDRVCAFFGLPVDQAFLRQKFNQTSGNTPLDAKIREQAEQHFADVYDYCFAQYPQTRKFWQLVKKSP